MPQLEALSKRAAIVSLLTILVLQQMLHPDATWLLRAMTTAALVLGWIGARSGQAFTHRMWLLFAPLAPATLMLVTGRQGEPLLDVVWMAGLAGVVTRTISWSRWTFPPLWSLLLGGWALTLSLAWPVMALREIGFDPELLRDVGAINSWAGIAAPHVVTWTFYVVATQLLGVLWFDWVYGELARVGAPDGRPHVRHGVPRAVHGLWIGVTAASVVAIVQGTVDLTFLNTEFWAGERRAGGTMLNPNAYGVAAACAGPLAFLALRAWRPAAASLGVAVLAVNWAGLWLSGSRTATFLCGLAGALGLAVGLWRSRERLAINPLAVTAATLAAVLMAAVVATSISDPLERLGEIPVTREGLANVWNRGSYAPIARQITREYPLTGVGIGAFHYLAPDYERVNRDDRLPFDNAQNWWRHQLAEFGIIGGAFVLLWSVSVGWVVIRGLRQHTSVAETWTARALILGIAAVSLVGMPTQSPVVLLSFFLLVAMVSARSPGAVPALPPRWLSAGWALAVVLSVTYAAGHLVLASGQLSVAERARRFRHEYVAGAYPPERPDDSGRFVWTDDESRFILPARSRWLVMRLWAHHPDIADRPVRVAVSTSCGVLFERDLTTTLPVSVWIDLPSDTTVVDATVTSSRTWTPADFGSQDSRRLGVAVLTDYQESTEAADPQDVRVEWQGCGG